MRKIFTALLFFISIALFSQDEKRLALVIGNANYDEGELKNPVNDARLIASTLDSLDFDVILKENLENRTDFIRSIREFGNKRSEYDVAFVYYAGHGIQVDDENFLLPTNQEFSSEEDVLDFGVSVQNIMRYLKAQTNEVNILILDACRDNPFESNWNSTRSLKGGGLAKIPPPTGSLIAFSTDSGQTAPDGDGENSAYTLSLAKNMLLEDTSIDQVFRNVRAEVLSKTDGMQRPVEATQLTGQTFYFKKRPVNSYEKEFLYLINNDDFENARILIDNMIKNHKKNHITWLLNGHILNIENKFIEAIKSYETSLKIKVTSNGLISFVGEKGHQTGIIKSIQQEYFAKDSLDNKMTNVFTNYFNQKDKTIDDILILAEMFGNLNYRTEASQLYQEYLNILDQLKKTQKNNFSVLDYNYTFSKKNQIDSITKYAKSYNLEVHAYKNLYDDYSFDGQYDKSLEFINKAIEIEPNNFELFYRKAESLINIKKLDEAEIILNNLINNSEIVRQDNNLYRLARIKVFKEEYEEAIKLINNISLQPKDVLEQYTDFDWYGVYFYLSVINYVTGNLIDSYSNIMVADYIYPDIWYTQLMRALNLAKLKDKKTICKNPLLIEFMNEKKYTKALGKTFPNYTFKDQDYWINEVKYLIDYYNSECNQNSLD
ncbi:MAG: caspase family protein [Bacteroidota bacterium]|nr:caspase family protein [Bacteroidota bacterium]MEC8363650.1 caspase family protein [Bacteroidota bacterium]